MSHPVAGVLADVEPALAVAGDGGGAPEGGLQRGVAAAIGSARAGDQAHRAVGRDLAEAVVAQVGEVQIALGVQVQAGRPRDLRRRALAVGVAFGAADEGGHHAGGADPTDVVVGVIADKDIALGVDRDAEQLVEGRRCGLTVDVAWFAAAGDGGDRAIERHLADAEVAGVGHVDGASGVGGDVSRHVEPGLHALAVGKPGVAACDGGDRPVKIEPPNPMVGRVRDVQRTLGAHGQSAWLAKSRLEGGTVARAGHPPGDGAHAPRRLRRALAYDAEGVQAGLARVAIAGQHPVQTLAILGGAAVLGAGFAIVAILGGRDALASLAAIFDRTGVAVAASGAVVLVRAPGGLVTAVVGAAVAVVA